MLPQTHQPSYFRAAEALRAGGPSIAGLSVGPGDLAESFLAGCGWRQLGLLYLQTAEPWDSVELEKESPWPLAGAAAEVCVGTDMGLRVRVPHGLWGQFLCFMDPESSGGKWGFSHLPSPVLIPGDPTQGHLGHSAPPPIQLGKIPWTEEIPREGAAEPSAPRWPFQPTRRHPDHEKPSIAEPPAPEEARTATLDFLGWCQAGSNWLSNSGCTKP